MGLLQSVIKFYLVVLMFRSAMTRQELYFNPLGKLVAKMTDPVLEKAFKLTKKGADNILPIFLVLAVLLDGLVIFMLTGYGIIIALLAGLADILTFLMLFYIVSTILGGFAGNASMTHYAMFFKRIASFWVKLTRTFFPIKSNGIILPAVIIIFAFFTLAIAGVNIGYQTVTSGINPVASIMSAARSNLLSVAGLLDIFVWLVIIRALMSWVSPDPRNPVVQIIHSLTEPVMEPFRKIIPTIGAIDISPMVLIFVVYFLKTLLVRLVGIIF
ncbi:protein of unknown function YGGT [Denitrovibrio acetiphilus DSM 12809]|uniref:YggT family protein n=1 Tax=Denitrovibrio acetiphilus (strain DSM 12809 / NBRC 114555 / N2460) TaxID=522772 RepID=D4H7Y1_DENA2|nr:YggT family protein [Denitrovibrio acetiphilus]ADD68130.1 protein of unknown function YGGT [Denitrovibrio acetiphilus DSM 12809]